MTSSVFGPRRSSKTLPKAKLAPKKKVMVTVWWSAACLIDCTCNGFAGIRILAKPSHLRSTLSRWMRCTEHRSRQWSTERARLFSPAVPGRPSHKQHIRRWPNWAAKFCLVLHIRPTSRSPATASSNVSTPVGSENASTTSRMQKTPSKSSSNPQAWIFLPWKTELFIFGKNVLL